MCGITGAVWTDPKAAVSPETLRRMTDVLAHRGPDDRGQFASELVHRAGSPATPGVALGHRRLSILDLAGGRQPIANEDGSIQLVFNGEIYNYRDLRRRLEGSGHVFRTAGDTETLIHLYEDEGLDFLRHTVGMFALALWDAPRRRLLLARDRLGQKPLVYRLEKDRLLFASELKSLLAVPGVPREIDPAALDEYLTFQYVPHPNTIFRGIRKLPPAHLAVYEEGRLKITRYWSPDPRSISTHLDSKDHIRQLQAAADDPPTAVRLLRDTLTEAVRLRLQSDVPLGAFLSGGVDSSVIVALAQQQSDQPVETFSIGFPVPEYDESRFARRVAVHLGTRHHEFHVEPSAVDVLPKLVWHFDEPFADSSAIPTYYLSQLTRQHVTVALSGDGGDELFAGYPRYRAVRLASRLDRLPAPLRRLLSTDAWRRLPSSGRQRSAARYWKRFADALAMSPQRRYAEWVTIFNLERRATLYREEFLAQLPESDPIGFLLAAYQRWSSRDIVTATSLVDLETYLPCDLMTKVDIASMAHGLECRQPLLDHRVVELAAALPLRMKMRGRRTKWILRRAFGDLLPREVFTRKKMGFGVPLDRWFRGELRPLLHDVLLDPAALRRGYFRPEAVRQLIREHLDGAFDHAYRLWSLLVLELWSQRWTDGPPTTDPPAANG